MSGKLVIQVIRTARAHEGEADGALASPLNLLTLMLLADSANKGGVCWPSIAALSRQSRLSPRSVRYALHALKTEGHISVEKRPGRNDRYTIHPGKRCRGTAARDATVGADQAEPWQEMPLPRQEVPDTVARGADESYQEPNKKSGARSGFVNSQHTPKAKGATISGEELAKMRADPVAYWNEREAADHAAGGVP